MNKRGTATVLAMIFLVIFTALSYAFYAMVNTATTVGKNDRNSVRSRAAAESGMEYLKHQLARISLPPDTADSAVLGELQTSLGDKLDMSVDRASPSGVVTIEGDPATGQQVNIPELYLQPQNPLTKKYPQSFMGRLTEMTYGSRKDLLLGIDGYDKLSGLRRSIYAQFRSMPAGRDIFLYDMASAGTINLKGAHVKGSGLSGQANVMSASTATTSITVLNSQVEGDFAVVVSTDQVPGVDPSKVTVTDPPTIPGFDPNVFRDLTDGHPVAWADVPSTTVYTNKVISAHTGGQTKFSSGTVINGILFIEPPNDVVFQGNVTLNGIIVFGEGFKPNGDRYGPADCTITMSGNYDFVQNTAAIPADPPDLAEKIAGYTILAPYAKVTFGGSANISAEGSIICDSLSIKDNGGSFNINNGTLLTLSTGANALDISPGTVTFSGTSVPPSTGIKYWRHYVMVPSTDPNIDPAGIGYEEMN